MLCILYMYIHDVRRRKDLRRTCHILSEKKKKNVIWLGVAREKERDEDEGNKKRGGCHDLREGGGLLCHSIYSLTHAPSFFFIPIHCWGDK